MTYEHTREKSLVDFDWKEDGVEDELRKLHDDGNTAPEIAHALTQKFGGVLSRSAVCGKINRLGLSVAQQNTVWKEDFIVELKQLHGQGLRADRIADKLTQQFGVTFTRNGVYHKIHRLGLSVKARKQNFVAPILVVKTEPPIDLSADEIPIKQRKKIFDLKEGDCRWPYGDVGKPDFFFCGATAHPGEPYCRHHCVIAYPNWHPRHMRAA